MLSQIYDKIPVIKFVFWIGFIPASLLYILSLAFLANKYFWVAAFLFAFVLVGVIVLKGRSGYFVFMFASLLELAICIQFLVMERNWGTILLGLHSILCLLLFLVLCFTRKPVSCGI